MATFEALRHVGARAGLTILATRRVRNLPQAEYLRRLFLEWRITSVIDVGANEGQYHKFIRSEVDFEGPVLSLEPIPALAEHLMQSSAGDKNWKVERVAAGAQPGNARFNITQGSQFSSFHQPSAASLSGFGGDTSVSQSVEVRVDTLDEIVQRHRAFLGDRIYLKLDTQGYDLEALRGLSKHANLVVALQSEASVRPIYEGAPDYIQSIRAIQEMGFTISQIFPNNEGFFPLLVEFDCHFVRLPESGDWRTTYEATLPKA